MTQERATRLPCKSSKEKVTTRAIYTSPHRGLEHFKWAEELAEDLPTLRAMDLIVDVKQQKFFPL